MRKKVEVTITKIIDIEIPDDSLSIESINEFESYMWKLDGENKVDELFGYAATQCALYDDNYIEGLGRAMSFDNRDPEKRISYKEVSFESEFEIIKEK